MATVHPFRAVRPDPEHVEEIASVPYDVVSVEEARLLAEGKPRSFLHVIRPEIDLPVGIDEHDDAVYAKGAENLRAFVESTETVREAEPSLYVYRLVMNGREQVGVFGCVAVAEYDDDTILKHEKTRQAKEDDRTRHILTQQAHAEPVMLTYRDSGEVNALVARTQAEAPLYDFVAEDGVRHTVWRAPEPERLAEAFRKVERLYVADGHHRCAAASRAAAALRERGQQIGEAAFFPAVLFPMGQMMILPYNRVVRRLPDGQEVFLARLKERLEVREAPDGVPGGAGRVRMYVGQKWYAVALPESAHADPAGELDVARLSEHVLTPLLGIGDPRTDPNLDFVGGIRGTGELERLVDSGKAALAFSMHPTSVEQLVRVSDAGMLMPPKSTWFEPKLRSGLLVHTF